MVTPPPLFSAVTSSARQVLFLLRCISFSKKAQVRVSADGLRFSTEEGSSMEAFIFLEKSLFSSYIYHAPPAPSSQDDPPEPPIFEICLESLLEALNIFSLSDPNTASKRSGGGGDFENFAAHRVNRYAPFSNHALGMSGICTFTYDGEGSPLSVYMAEGVVTTTCDLTTYEANSTEDIPFNRDAVALKTIMRASYLLDAVVELNNLNPATVTILASPSSRSGNSLSLSAGGAQGSATVEFTSDAVSEAPVLETFQCPNKTSANFSFSVLKCTQRAMAVATKVSLRMDDEGVLSLQFLVEVETAAVGGGEGVIFVDFRAVPLAADEDDDESEDTGSD